METRNYMKIRIKKKNRGTFTAAATKHGKSVQEFARQVLANPENYSPAMRRKANFARNSAKWHKHEDGGSNWMPDFTKFTENKAAQYDIGKQLVQSILQDENIQRAIQQKSLQRQAEIEAERRATHEIYNGLPNPGAGYVSGTDPLLQAIVDMTPAGDAEMATEAASELRNGNLKEAGLLGAALLLPNIFNKGIKEWRAARKLKKEGEDYTNALLNFLGKDSEVSTGEISLAEVGSDSFKGDLKELYSVWKDSGVDLSKFTSSDLRKASRLRLEALQAQNPSRFVLDVQPDGFQTSMRLYDREFTSPIGNVDYNFVNHTNQRYYDDHFGIFPTLIQNLTEYVGDDNKMHYLAHGVSEDLYNALIKRSRDLGLEGLLSGQELLSPETTYRVWEKYLKGKTKISDRGIHTFNRGENNEFKKLGPIMLLSEPSKQTLPIKSSAFHPSVLTKDGKMIIDWTGDRLHSTGGPLYPFSFQKNPYWKTPVVRY